MLPTGKRFFEVGARRPRIDERGGGAIKIRKMGVPDVEQAKRRLQDILRKAQKLEISPQEVISTRTAQKLLARTRNVLAWTIWITVFVLLLSGVVYARWPTRQEVETIRTVLRRTCTGATSGDFSERVAALLQTSTTQDDC